MHEFDGKVHKLVIAPKHPSYQVFRHPFGVNEYSIKVKSSKFCLIHGFLTARNDCNKKSQTKEQKGDGEIYSYKYEYPGTGVFYLYKNKTEDQVLRETVDLEISGVQAEYYLFDDPEMLSNVQYEQYTPNVMETQGNKASHKFELKPGCEYGIYLRRKSLEEEISHTVTTSSEFIPLKEYEE